MNNLDWYAILATAFFLAATWWVWASKRIWDRTNEHIKSNTMSLVKQLK